ncbi:MAG TPA: hypothetical protein VJ183_03595 [Chloroflexia bacterium]|nr:hypothetical protein [Chloroflexia bacterium]
MIFAHSKKPVEIAIEIDGAENPFFAGDKVKATITLTTTKGGEVKTMHAGLLFHSRHQSASKAGKKDDEEVINHPWVEHEEWVADEELLGKAELARGLNNAYHLEWQIPAGATPSYRGDIIQQTYKVVVELDRAEGKGLKEEVELQVVEPAPPGNELRQRSYGKGKNAEDARMQFELLKLGFVEGETLAGRLLVEPYVDIEARSIQLELWRIETVTEGGTPNVKPHRAQTHALTGITILKKGEPATYEFSFPVAIEGCPAFKDAKAKGSWLLKAIITRPLALDCEVEQEVYLYGAYRQG